VIENLKLKERTAVVVSTGALRSLGLDIPGLKSLETTAFDLVRHVEPGSILQKLLDCRHVFIFEDNWVCYFDKTIKNRCDYYIRPYEVRPEFVPSQFGRMSGYGKILIASIIKEMLPKVDKLGSFSMSNLHSGIPEGIRLALSLWAKHFDEGFSVYPVDGYLKDEEEPHPFDHLFLSAEAKEAKFKKYRGKEKSEIEDDKEHLVKVEIPFILDTLRTWSRVTAFREKNVLEQDFVNCISDVVRKEIKSNDPILAPFGRLGKLISVDREELDGYMDIHGIVSKYLQDRNWETPLSLAVFGPPGSGKSFTVGEILEASRSTTAGAGGGGDALVYNLAQFTKPENLTTAFHQVQDRALSGVVPLIFFDEFDADFDKQPYGWLKYFLAPMQDGKFKGAEAEGSYRVGKAIFVFAGGTAETFDAFKKAASKEDQNVRNAKGKDFISRLRAYLNIKGIDKKEDEDGVSDLLALRRAVILRSILSRKAAQIFDDTKTARIDDRLIHAFLRIGSYEHGIRSMEAIVEMSRPTNGRLQVASLPSRDQLRMHVDAELFLDLATRSSQ
jgi:hypothetical protein